MRIPLPKFRRVGEAKAHAYPFRISLQTIEVVQASVFLVMLGDLAAGEYFRTNGSSDRIEAQVIAKGLFPQAAEEGWQLLKKYKGLLERSVFQNVLITMRSNWDWYLRRLSEFVRHARQFVDSPELSPQMSKKFNKIHRCDMLTQIDLLQTACGLSFEIAPRDLEMLREMSLVRNLGLHNRWEVDENYLAHSSVTRFGVGEVRIFDEEELTAWYSSLLTAIRKTGKDVAIKYVNVPEYPAVTS
jgi:hypothetical protein